MSEASRVGPMALPHSCILSPASCLLRSKTIAHMRNAIFKLKPRSPAPSTERRMLIRTQNMVHNLSMFHVHTDYTSEHSVLQARSGLVNDVAGEC